MDEVILASHVADTVETVVAMHRAQHDVDPHIRRIAVVSASIGHPVFLVCVIGFVILWMVLNTTARIVGIPPLDPPPFSWLQGLITLAALLMTMVVLITQNRQNRHIEQRARLDLQINLLSEQKITKLISLVEELRHDMPNVRNRVDSLANEMKKPVDTDAVISALDKTIDPVRAVT